MPPYMRYYSVTYRLIQTAFDPRVNYWVRAKARIQFNRRLIRQLVEVHLSTTKQMPATGFQYAIRRNLHIIKTVAEMRSVRRKLIQSNKSVGFVPTMGALHHGHLTLMEQAKKENDIAVASIYVNPTQFSAGEDFDKYPRTIDKDASLVQGKIDYLFAPSESEMYPYGKNQVCHVEPTPFNKIYEGVIRPEFFRGVATVVCKLLNIVQPDNAYFGQKDISQCILVRQLVTDLNIPSEIRVLETVRESDGLAMSSRNVYLTASERPFASVVYKALHAGKSLIESKSNPDKVLSAAEVVNVITSVLKEEPLVTSIDYVSVASHVDMTELKHVRSDTGAVLSTAIRLGNVRLIDNLLVGRAYHEILQPAS